MKIGYAFLLVIFLSACGQTGPLYMPGTATGVHKKDEFVLGNSQQNQKKPAATKNTTPPAASTTTPPKPETINEDTSVAKSADNSTTPNEDNTPLAGADAAVPGEVQ